MKRLQTRTVKAVKYCRVLHGALSRLEPCEVKVSRRVLRVEGDRKVSDLPGIPYTAVQVNHAKVTFGNHLLSRTQYIRISSKCEGIDLPMFLNEAQVKRKGDLPKAKKNLNKAIEIFK